MWDGSSLGERGARPATDGEPETFEGGFKDNPGCRPDGRCGVAGVVEMELSSLLDCRSAPRGMDSAVYTGLGASESDRDLGEVRFPGSRGVPLSDEASVFTLDSPSSARWDSCSLSLLSNRDAGKLGAKGKGFVDDVMLAIQGLVGLCYSDKRERLSIASTMLGSEPWDSAVIAGIKSSPRTACRYGILRWGNESRLTGKGERWRGGNC